MRHIAIAGGWKEINEQVRNDVHASVSEIMARGDGIICGGALGVDFEAVQAALEIDPNADRIQVLIPSELAYYILDLEKDVENGLATKEAVHALIAQLTLLQDRGALIEGFETVLSKETYFRRIDDIIESADALVAFHINETEGTQRTIDGAHKKGIPVEVHTYTI